MKKKMLSFLCLSLILSMTACGAKEDLPNSVAETYTEESVESQVFVPSPTVVTMRSDDDGPCDVLPIIMVNGKLYSATGEKSTVTGRCGNMDGEITSSTNYMSLPTEDNQSNFGVGYGYQYGFAENTIEVFMNDEWCVFALMEEEPTLVEIIDLTVVKQLSTDSAMEEFFKDEDFTYYFPSIKSEYIECRFSDGATMNVADAINHYKISIADLDTYGIGYWKVDKEGIFSEATTSRVSVDEGHIKKTVISGEFTVTVRDVIPDYMYDASTPQVAIVTEFQSYPFTVYVGEEIGSQLQKDTVYVFSVMPFEVEYSVNEVDKMDLSALAWKGMRITGVRLAEENELGLESLRLTYTKKDI